MVSQSLPLSQQNIFSARYSHKTLPDWQCCINKKDRKNELNCQNWDTTDKIKIIQKKRIRKTHHSTTTHQQDAQALSQVELTTQKNRQNCQKNVEKDKQNNTLTRNLDEKMSVP